MQARQRLNDVRATTADMANNPAWRAHTAHMMPTARVIPQLRAAFEENGDWQTAALCTRAFSKFGEMLMGYDLLDAQQPDSSLRSVHLCEAPGAFVGCLSAQLKRCLFGFIAG